MGPSYQFVLKVCECIQIFDKAMYMSVNDKIKYATSWYVHWENEQYE
jgi:hypothetical protein